MKHTAKDEFQKPRIAVFPQLKTLGRSKLLEAGSRAGRYKGVLASIMSSFYKY